MDIFLLLSKDKLKTCLTSLSTFLIQWSRVCLKTDRRVNLGKSIRINSQKQRCHVSSNNVFDILNE